MASVADYPPALFGGQVDSALDAGLISEEDLWLWLDLNRERVNDDLLAARVVLECATALADLEAPDSNLGAELRQEADQSRLALDQLSRELLIRVDGLRAGMQEQEAQTLLERGLQALPAAHDYVPYLLQQLADIACRNGQWGLALEFVNRALPIVAQRSRIAVMGPALLGMRGEIYLSMGLVDLAGASIEASLQEAEELQDKGKSYTLELFSAHRRRGELRLATDRYGKAIGEIDDFLKRYDPSEDTDKIARERAKLNLLLGLSCLELGLKDPELRDRARHLLERAVKLPQTDLFDRTICRTSLAFEALTSGDSAAAEHWLLAAKKEQATKAGPMERGYFVALEARLAMLRMESEERLKEERERLREIFEELLNGMDAEAPRAGGLAPLRYGRVRFLVETLMELEMLADQEHGSARALGDLYRLRGKGALIRRMGFEAPDFDQARRTLLPPGTGALVYFVGKDRSLLFAVERDRIIPQFLPGEWTLWQGVESLHKELLLAAKSNSQPRHHDRLNQKAQAAARDLLPPEIQARVKQWDTVYLVGDDLLHHSVFESLPFEDSTLGLKKALSHLDSLALGMALAHRVRPEFKSLERNLCLVAFSPPPDSDWPVLPIDEAVLEGLTAAYGEQAEVVLQGRSACLAVLQGRTDHPGVLSFLGHAIRDDSRERSRGILLYPGRGVQDGLYSDQVETLKPYPVVVLGVCRSGLGPAREGGGPSGHLGGAFLLAGARVVILSNSDLAFRPTVLLMEELHTQLAAGVGVAESLRRARLRVVEQGWSNPAHYSRLQAMGLAW